MEYNKEKREIILNRIPNELDKFALEFTKILKKYTDYVIISGYVSILLGRTRGTEDIDVWIKKFNGKFPAFYKEAKEKGFWCVKNPQTKVQDEQKFLSTLKFRFDYPKTKTKKSYKHKFFGINAEDEKEILSYFEEGYGVRFARENKFAPNFELKFPKREIDEETFKDSIRVILKSGELIISSLERQIAFKRYYLSTEKDIEDAEHIEQTFKGEIDYNLIPPIKREIEKIKEDERKRTSQAE